MLQDLKVGHILGGTPSKMQIGDIFGVIVASPILFYVLKLPRSRVPFRQRSTGGAAGRVNGHANRRASSVATWPGRSW